MTSSSTHNEQESWFESWRKTTQFAEFVSRPIVYFCAEFALESDFHSYAGGLGVLAGDVMKEAGDQKLPMIGMGLLYRKGYLGSAIPTKVTDAQNPESFTTAHAHIERVLDAQKKPVQIKMPIGDHDVSVQAWKWESGGTLVYFLDTDLEENAPQDRSITHQLYVGAKEARLKQELILGIGGLRMIEALGIHPLIYHMNEGHSGMLALELIRHEMMERSLSFDEARQFARRRLIFTNHTLVPAGNELYSNDLVSVILEKYANELEVPVSELVKLGLVQESSIFSMTMLSLRMAGMINAVSKLHAKKAKEIWADHPMVGITNGVHVPTWDAIEGSVDAPGAFWNAHQQNKIALLKIIEEKIGKKWGEDALLVGWARRFVRYKRPLAIFDEAEKLLAFARDSAHPVRFVFAGKPHPSDEDGVKMLQDLQKFIEEKASDLVVYLPEYVMDSSKMLGAGCDIWLNTPIVGFEACGTSGMKAALNGALTCSTKDGWIDEVNLDGIGWNINSDHVAQSFLELLEKEIAPAYYGNRQNGIPSAWEERMRKSRTLIQNQYSATRMLREYIEMMYV